ncbi:hypothetical protein SAMD00019534_068090 [Acytostelium subglobosum LB1]|uniref:hypothetical protein n=1 Tax=Acytostelium subglobosum LB1 TaxID=1410327 RepID=UPI00064512DA|nr:hypothetical protein SAMD00019534_068090 [Acytostelium subglobosum LB1]GAM23634.1 hypothetical protein SAMD00019534_068090 [Acytostelium subglobosum LB1]|eukprot:XP_012753375.1 hypothetical protein SAMD00019534_068090 [Acytostelium subglobosum LB1]
MRESEIDTFFGAKGVVVVAVIPFNQQDITTEEEEEVAIRITYPLNWVVVMSLMDT